MPSPAAFSSVGIDPFPPSGTDEFDAQSKLFYVTDRAELQPEDRADFYSNRRGHLARAGIADVGLSPDVQDWDEFVRITLSGERDRRFLLNIESVQEFGVLPFSASALYPSPPTATDMDANGRAFANAIDNQLAKSSNDDIHIYVHGYNVDFSFSTLVARELEHFLGYQGVFIAYNWAATPNRFAYFRDQETAMATRRNLRSLIEFLYENTNVRRVNLIGFSAGSRLVLETTYQMALMSREREVEPLGNVMLIASDLDRGFVGHSLVDGLLDATDRLSVYLSGTDSALWVSSVLFGRERLGQSWGEGDVWASLEEKLASLDGLEIIDVTDAEDSSYGNGHSFFRNSPWASSDIFLSLLTDLPASERGLLRNEGGAVWHFPSDYVERLKDVEALTASALR